MNSIAERIPLSAHPAGQRQKRLIKKTQKAKEAEEMADFFLSPVNSKSKKRKELPLSLPAKRACTPLRIPLSDSRLGDYNVSSEVELENYSLVVQCAQEQDKENTEPVSCTQLRFKLKVSSNDSMPYVVRSEAPIQPDSKCEEGELFQLNNIMHELYFNLIT
jgi:hypothetical protein